MLAERNTGQPANSNIVLNMPDYSALRSPPRNDTLDEDSRRCNGLSIPFVLTIILVGCVAAIVYLMLPQPTTQLIYLSPHEQITSEFSGFWFDAARIQISEKSNISAFISHRPPRKTLSRHYEIEHNLTITNNYAYQSYFLQEGSEYAASIQFDSPVSCIVLSSLQAYQKWRSSGFILADTVLIRDSFDNSGTISFTALQSDYYFVILYTPYTRILTGTVSLAIDYAEFYFDPPFNEINLRTTTHTLALNPQLNSFIILRSTSNQPHDWINPSDVLSDVTQYLEISTQARPGTFYVWWPMWTLTALAGIAVFVSALSGCFVVMQSFGVGGCGCEEEDDEERQPLLSGVDGEALPLYRAPSIANSCPSYHSVDDPMYTREDDDPFIPELENDSVSLHTMLGLPPLYKPEDTAQRLNT